MATYRKRSGKWRAELYRDGKRESGTFGTKAEAVAWATQREQELVGARPPDETVGRMFKKYAQEVSPLKRGEQWELLRLKAMQADPIAAVKVGSLKPADVAAWRDRRLLKVSSATVRREFNLLQSVFTVARKEWGWLESNPASDVRRPPSPASRKRRLSADEIDRLVMALGYSGGVPENISQRIAMAFLFALETAMRSGEITTIRWEDVREKSVRLPRTKNGDERSVPLSIAARALLKLLPRDSDTAFDLNARQRDALFRKARARAKLGDIHFHDSRAEAIWRLSKKLDVMELARVIGHRDLRSLMLYYNADADELAGKLG